MEQRAVVCKRGSDERRLVQRIHPKSGRLQPQRSNAHRLTARLVLEKETLPPRNGPLCSLTVYIHRQLCSLLCPIPVDIMAHVAWRQSGLPPTRVIGAGCNLDSERLSHVMDINLNTHKIAWVIGELSDNKGEPERIT